MKIIGSYPPLDQVLLEELEKSLSEKFNFPPLPSDYIDFLLQQNGGFVTPGYIESNNDAGVEIGQPIFLSSGTIEDSRGDPIDQPTRSGWVDEGELVSWSVISPALEPTNEKRFTAPISSGVVMVDDAEIIQVEWTPEWILRVETNGVGHITIDNVEATTGVHEDWYVQDSKVVLEAHEMTDMGEENLFSFLILRY